MANKKRVYQTTIGDRIRMARKAAKLTQIEFAKKVGISKGSLYFYESDMHEPAFLTIISIADALGESLDWLAGRSDKSWRDTK